MSRLLYTVALIIVLFLSQGDAATSIHQLERNATHVVLQCQTDLSQIILKVGDTPGFEPDEYGHVNGDIITATTTIPLTDNITVTCIGKKRIQNGFTSESDTFAVTVPNEASPSPPSGTVPSSNTESISPPSGTLQSNNITHTDYGSTPTTPTTPRGDECRDGPKCITENGTVATPTCGAGCITGVSVAVIVLCALGAIPILCVCCTWKKTKQRCATLCPKAKGRTQQQSDQDAGGSVPETNPSHSGSAVMFNGRLRPLAGSRANDMPVSETDYDPGTARATLRYTRLQQPHSSTDRSSMEGLTTTGNVNEMNATPGNDLQRFTDERGTAEAHVSILMEKDKDCS